VGYNRPGIDIEFRREDVIHMRLVRQKRAARVVFLVHVDCSRHGPQITVAVRAQMSCLVWLRFYGVLGGGDGMDGYSAMAEGLLFSIRDEKRGSISFQWASHNSEFTDDRNGDHVCYLSLRVNYTWMRRPAPTAARLTQSTHLTPFVQGDIRQSSVFDAFPTEKCKLAKTQ
jgi:hypothetical protein